MDCGETFRTSDLLATEIFRLADDEFGSAHCLFHLFRV